LKGISYLLVNLYSSTTYQVQPYLPAYTSTSTSAIIADQLGNLYVTYLGQNIVQQIKPDGTPGMQWSGLNSPSALVLAKDGSGLLAATNSGLYHLGYDGSQTQLDNQTDIGNLRYSPSGVLFGTSNPSSAIYQISDTGQVTSFVPAGTVSKPTAFTFDDAGNLIVAAQGSGQVLQIHPDKSIQVLLSQSGVTSVARYGQNWLVGGTSGIYLANAQWQATQLASQRADNFLVLPNGVIIFDVWNANGYSQLVPVPASIPATGTATGYNNLALNTPAGIMLGASVIDGTGSIAQVAFYNGNTLLNVAAQAPYTFNWSNIPPGNYTITALTTDNQGQTGISAPLNVTVAASSSGTPQATQTINFAPFVNTVNAINGGTPVTVSATASSGLPVSFSSNTPSVCTVNGTSVTLINPGTCTIAANQNGNASYYTALPVVQSFTVIAQQIISVNLTSPTAGQTLITPATLTVSATATDTAGPITQVAFYNGSTLIGTVTQAPYSITLPSIAVGSYSITAQASDNLGNAQTSAPVTVTVNAPINVSVTSPANGAQVSGHNFTLSAAASTTGASITQIAYYNGTTLIATATQAPFNVIFPDLEAGSYTFTAQATDSAGVVATSAPVTVTVTAAAGGTGGGTGTAELVYDIQSDQIGTPRMVTDANGNAVWQNDNTDPFGDNMPNQSPNGTGTQFVFNLRFPGQYADVETGTYYNYFRDYDPVTGRYLESDLIGLRAGQASTYAYVRGNPNKFTDRAGLMTDCELMVLRTIVNIYGAWPHVTPDNFTTDPTMGAGHAGFTDVFGNTTIGTNPAEGWDQYSGSVMDNGKLYNAIDTAIHENVHQAEVHFYYLPFVADKVKERLTGGAVSTAEDIAQEIMNRNPQIVDDFKSRAAPCKCKSSGSK
jgi:RHS repeat-associated protein